MSIDSTAEQRSGARDKSCAEACDAAPRRYSAAEIRQFLDADQLDPETVKRIGGLLMG
jgi:hypothetical protein